VTPAKGDKATERARRFDFVRLMRPVGEHAAVDEGWVIIELVDEEGRPRGVLNVDLSDLELVQGNMA
jgi:hypothetical protein